MTLFLGHVQRQRLQVHEKGRQVVVGHPCVFRPGHKGGVKGTAVGRASGAHGGDEIGRSPVSQANQGNQAFTIVFGLIGMVGLRFVAYSCTISGVAVTFWEVMRLFKRHLHANTSFYRTLLAKVIYP